MQNAGGRGSNWQPRKQSSLHQNRLLMIPVASASMTDLNCANVLMVSTPSFSTAAQCTEHVQCHRHSKVGQPRSADVELLWTLWRPGSLLQNWACKVNFIYRKNNIYSIYIDKWTIQQLFGSTNKRFGCSTSLLSNSVTVFYYSCDLHVGIQDHIFVSGEKRSDCWPKRQVSPSLK